MCTPLPLGEAKPVRNSWLKLVGVDPKFPTVAPNANASASQLPGQLQYNLQYRIPVVLITDFFFITYR